MNIERSKEVYRSKIFRVTEDVATDPSGFEIHRSIVRHAGSAVMMAVEENKVLLVKQFRLPAQKELWELPAGKVDDGETPLEAAKRELVEETGYAAELWEALVSYYPSPGFVEEKMNLFLATSLTKGSATPMEDERIEVRWFGREELRNMVQAGQIEDGKTLVGFLLWDSPPMIEYVDASPEVRAVYDDIMRTRGTDWVNNFWKALAHDPATLRRTWESIKQIMAPGALPAVTKEMIYLAVSVTNGCPYCIASHGAAARKAGMTEEMFGETMAVVGMANETNRLANGYRVEIDPQFQVHL